MAIAISVDEFLSRKGIGYELIKHPTADTAYNTAVASHLPSDQVSKAIVLKNERSHLLMAVVPSGRRLALDEVNLLTGDKYHLVRESELEKIFTDCEPGATPSLAEAYNMEMVLDDSLLEKDQVYIEAGDHQHLLALKHDEYIQLIKNFPHAAIAGSAIGMPRDADRMDTEWTI